MKLRILLADDHEILRQGLRMLLEEEEDITVVGEAGDGRELLEAAGRLRPDVVVMDVAMPELNGVDATRLLKRSHPEIRVVALSMHRDAQFVSGMLRAGACGYLLKDCAFEELGRAVRAAAAGETYLCSGIAGLVVEGYVRGGPDGGGTPELTAREREVLQLVAEGWATKQIAGRLGISVKTVEAHRSQMMKKLGMHSVAELTKYAVRKGLTSLEK